LCDKINLNQKDVSDAWICCGAWTGTVSATTFQRCHCAYRVNGYERVKVDQQFHFFPASVQRNEDEIIN